MARTLSQVKLTLKITGNFRNILGDGSEVSVVQPNLNYIPPIGNGFLANQADRPWQGTGSLAEHGDEAILDLFEMEGVDIGGGVGKDALGQVVDYENVVAIIIVNDNPVGTPGRLEIYPAHSQGWTPIGTHTVANGGALAGQGALCKIQIDEGGFDISDGNQRLTLMAKNGPVDWSVYLLCRSRDHESSSSASSSSAHSSQSSASSNSSSLISSASQSSKSSGSSSSQSSSSVT